MKCAECKTTSLNGIMEHSEGCSGRIDNTLDYLRPPATELVFDSEEERKNFMKNLESSSASQSRQRKPFERIIYSSMFWHDLLGYLLLGSILALIAIGIAYV